MHKNSPKCLFMWNYVYLRFSVSWHHTTFVSWWCSSQYPHLLQAIHSVQPVWHNCLWGWSSWKCWSRQNRQLCLCHLLTRLWKKFVVLVFIFRVLGLVPHEFGSRVSVGLLQEKGAPCEGKYKDSSAEMRSCSEASLCLEERRNEDQHGFCILL